jgi:hypothetical protein
MAFERRQTPRDEELRRRAARLDEREARLVQRERDVAARESELRSGDVDRRLREALLGDQPSRRSRAARIARRGVPVAAALWLMAFPLAFSADRGAVRAAAVIAGAALAFVTLARARLQPVAGLADWGLAAVGTWLLAWGGLAHATAAAGWALAASGALVWAMALLPPPR